jgi:ribosomal protein S18 acetylase RimI-like enzyme
MGDTVPIFRQLASDELDTGYQCLLDTCAWLAAKQIRQWANVLPREVYARRHGRGENYGLFHGTNLVGIVSLVRGVPRYWHDLCPHSEALWMATLAARRSGQGIGETLMTHVLTKLRSSGHLPLYLDCKPGFLEGFYQSFGFEPMGRREFQPAPDVAFEAVLMRYPKS